jgi:hypothetical protein
MRAYLRVEAVLAIALVILKDKGDNFDLNTGIRRLYFIQWSCILFQLLDMFREREFRDV